MRSYTESWAVSIYEGKYDSGISLWKWCDKYGSRTVFSGVCQISEAFSQMPTAKWIKPWLKLQSNLTLLQARAQMLLFRCLLASWPSSQETVFKRSNWSQLYLDWSSVWVRLGGPSADGILGRGFSRSAPLTIGSSYSSEKPPAIWPKPRERWFYLSGQPNVAQIRFGIIFS